MWECFCIISFPRNFKVQDNPPSPEIRAGIEFCKSIFSYFHLRKIFALWWDICTFVASMKEPETPTRSGSVLLWGPAWVRPFTTWSGGETNTVFVFVFFSRLSETSAAFVLVSWRDLFLYPRKHETTIWQGPSFPGPWKWSSINPPPFSAKR